MTTRDFAYWLQGFFEISNTNKLTPNQVQEIKNHLQLVFKKETPDISEYPLLDYLKDNLPKESFKDLTISC